MTRQRKGKAKEVDQEAWLNETNLQEDNVLAEQGKVGVEKKTVHHVSTTQEEIAVTIESVITGITRIANTSRKINAKWENCPFIHPQEKKRSTSPPRETSFHL